MRSTFLHFLQLHARNVTTEVLVAMLIVYLAMLCVTFHSIHRDTRTRSRLWWTLGVTLAPILGMALYCIACLRHGEFQFLQSMGLLKRQKPRF